MQTTILQQFGLVCGASDTHGKRNPALRINYQLYNTNSSSSTGNRTVAQLTLTCRSYVYPVKKNLGFDQFDWRILMRCLLLLYFVFAFHTQNWMVLKMRCAIPTLPTVIILMLYLKTTSYFELYNVLWSLVHDRLSSLVIFDFIIEEDPSWGSVFWWIFHHRWNNCWINNQGYKLLTFIKHLGQNSWFGC